MTYYLREQSIWEMIWNSFSIYVRYFSTFFTYSLLLFPFSYYSNFLFLKEELEIEEVIVFSILYWFVFTLSLAVINILISDIYLGNKPDLLRSCKQVFKITFIIKLLYTYLLVLVVVFTGVIGVLLFIFIILAFIFIFIFMLDFVSFEFITLLSSIAIEAALAAAFIFTFLWVLFFVHVVTFEGIWGIDALKRSKTLGENYYLRNFFIFIMATVIGSLVIVLLIRIERETVNILGLLNYWMIVESLMLSLIEFFTTPIFSIFMLLMYYDLRVRKEGYNNNALAEDLKH